MENVYDVIILGGGPAGLASAIYAGRSRLNGIMIEKLTDGGQLAITAEIENYPGSHLEETGAALIERMVAQVDKFGIKRVYDTVEEVDFSQEVKVIKSAENTYHAYSVIICTGATPRFIGCPGEKELTGMGVSYCATCDGAFFEDMEVFVIGGGDTAVEEAVYLTRFARKVTIVHRRDELRAVKSIIEHAQANPKIEYLWDTVVKEIKGDGVVSSMIVENVKTGETKEIFADENDGTFGIFVFIGFLPNSRLFEGKIELAEGGYIDTDADMKTPIPGVFAAGDIRVKSLRQVVTAAGDGAIAAMQADKYVQELKHNHGK